MATVFANNVVEIAVIQEYAGRPVVNVWHMRHDEEAFSGSMAEMVRDFANNWQDHIMPLQSSDVTLFRYEYRSLDAGTPVVGTLQPSEGKAFVGGKVGAGAPPNVAALVHKRTQNRPRGRRDGRAFIAGIVEGDIGNDGGLLATALTEWNSALGSFYNGISDSSINWAGDTYPVVLETTPESRAPGTAEVTINSRRITSLQIDATVSTQRDRLR